MASTICKGCDLYMPQNPRLRGRECAAFKTCTENDFCGTRIPSLRWEQENATRVAENAAKIILQQSDRKVV